MATHVTDTPTNQCRHVVARRVLSADDSSKRRDKKGDILSTQTPFFHWDNQTVEQRRHVCFFVFFNSKVLGVKTVENRT